MGPTDLPDNRVPDQGSLYCITNNGELKKVLDKVSDLGTESRVALPALLVSLLAVLVLECLLSMVPYKVSRLKTKTQLLNLLMKSKCGTLYTSFAEMKKKLI